MAAAEVDIYNMALSHCANSTEVQVTTENTPSANACRRFFAQARDEILEDWAWPFATKVVTLALVANNPTLEWSFSYRYPSDCMTMLRIQGVSGSSSRTPTRSDRISYVIRADTTGSLIYTDMQNAVAEYTYQLTDTTRWPATFVQAMACLLAFYIAPRVTAGDPSQLIAKCWQKYQWALARAQANAANEEQIDPEPDSEFIEVRNNGQTWPSAYPPVSPFG